MSDEAPQAETLPPFCKNGHPLRTLWGKHRCSRTICGEERLREEKAQREAEKLNPELRRQRLDAKKQRPLEVTQVVALSPEQSAQAAFEARAKLVKLPKGLTGDAATKWAQDKMIALLPEAIASVAYDLRHGSDKQRGEATDKVLRANGMDKRDAGAGQQGGLIVLNLGASQTEAVPWLQRMQNVKLPEGED